MEKIPKKIGKSYMIYIYTVYICIYIYIDIHISIISMKYGEKINQLYIYKCTSDLNMNILQFNDILNLGRWIRPIVTEDFYFSSVLSGGPQT